MAPEVFNNTPFEQHCLLLMEPDGQLCLSLILCATYVFDEAGAPLPAPAPAQASVPLADEPYGEPGRSSLRRASAASKAKRAVDVIVQAHAHAPPGREATSVDVCIQAGGWSKSLHVSGDRRWGGVLGSSPSAPRPFSRMPLRYERAFGGTLLDDDGRTRACCIDNPLGVAWKGARPGDSGLATEVPNIELPDQRMSAPGDIIPVAGFGAIAPNWAPRAGFAGTYDQAWLDTRYPALPADFDERFWQSAPLDQQWPDAMPGAEVQLLNMTPDGRWRFRMPELAVNVRVISSRDVSTHRLRVDTVHIDAESRTVSLIARHCLTRLRGHGLVSEVVFGEVSAAWLRARATDKRYIGRSEPADAA